MNDIFETLSKLSKSKRKEPSYIYLDEQDNQIKEVPISKMDSAGSALINKAVKKKINEAKLIRDSLNID